MPTHLTPDEIGEIAGNLKISDTIVSRIANKHPRWSANLIYGQCIDYRGDELEKLFPGDVTKVSFWKGKGIPLDLFKGQSRETTDDELVEIENVTGDDKDSIADNLQGIPSGFVAEKIKYMQLLKFLQLVHELDISEDEARRMSETKGKLHEIVDDYFKVAESKGPLNHEPLQQEISELVREIQCIPNQENSGDFATKLVTAFTKQENTDALTREYSRYADLNRTKVYFWDDIQLIENKCAIYARRLAILFQICEEKWDVKMLTYIRAVLDVCHRRTEEEWSEINKYLWTLHSKYSGCSAQNTLRGIPGATYVYMPAWPHAALNAPMAASYTPCMFPRFQTPACYTGAWKQYATYACVPRTS